MMEENKMSKCEKINKLVRSNGAQKTMTNSCAFVVQFTICRILYTCSHVAELFRRLFLLITVSYLVAAWVKTPATVQY